MTDKTSAPKDADKAPNKSPRRRAREYAVQGLYQFQLTGDSVGTIERFLRDSSTAFNRADEGLFREIFYGAMNAREDLMYRIEPCLDRSVDEVSPVEKAILQVAAFELLNKPETPYAVIINEAIELAKTFGGTDGHRFVNGVLDKLAVEVRAAEVAQGRKRK
ncbi:transcription antitermination factor NusB [Burkholderiaceae bacterium DAT-1]|nr:transcription antitermination factor NusB [Burkholderiaceae bacterium DAT-1]